jgi:cysteine desulfurase
MRKRTYLDWNAGAPLLPEAAAAVARLLGESVGNPSSVHAEGRKARDLVEEARQEVATLVAAPADAVVFTAGGSEANAAALHGVLRAGAGAAGKALVLPRVEHPSLLAAAAQAEREGAAVRYVRVGGGGEVDLAHLEALLGAGDVALVCLQCANSETGVLQPVAAAAALARAHGAAALCDAVQAAGKIAVGVADLGVDLLTLSAHKLGGLAGAGALVAGREIEPLIPGSQEHHRRGGTENLAGIVAFGAAARVGRLDAGRWLATGELRSELERELAARVPGLTIYGGGVRRLPNTTCVGLPPPLLGGVMVAALDLRGFAVSSGSACSSGVERGSVVLEAMGIGSDDARRAVRVSLGPATSAAEVYAFVGALAEAVAAGKGGRP